MVEFNIEELYSSYGNIVETCIVNGYALPVLLKREYIPEEYCLSYERKQFLFKGMTNELREKLYDMLCLRKDMISRINKSNGVYSLDDFYNDELLEFLEEFPIFKSIIK